MNKPKAVPLPLSDFGKARAALAGGGAGRARRQARSEQPLGHRDQAALHAATIDAGERYMEPLGFPGQPPMTRGIYATMHRGRTWTQRQLIGLGVPEDYNARLKAILAHGGTRGVAHPLQLGLPRLRRRRGAARDPRHLRRDRQHGRGHGRSASTAFPSATSRPRSTIPRRSRCWRWSWPSPSAAASPGSASPAPRTSRDYLSHFVANHMFFRLALPGARRVLLDHIAFARRHLPRWNPLSIVGQHMQQAGATPAEAMGFTLVLRHPIRRATAWRAAGIPTSSCRASRSSSTSRSASSRRSPSSARAGASGRGSTRERFGAKDPRSWRFKFHGQTSGVDLTREQPLNNIAARHGAGDGRHLRRAAVAAHRCLRRGAVGADREGGAHRRRRRRTSSRRRRT